MKRFLLAAALIATAAPAHAQWDTAWGKAAGQYMCAELRKGKSADVAADIAMNAVLANATLKADFVRFAQMSGGIAQMNAEIEMLSGVRAACPQFL